MKTSKAKVVVSMLLGKISSIAGYILGTIGALGLIIELTSPFYTSDGIMLSLFFLVPGGFLIYNGSQIKRRRIRFKQYVWLISTQNITSIDNIAVSTSRSVDFVKNDLQKMINKRFFANARIDYATNEIIICGRQIESTGATAQTTPQGEMEVVSCAGCGASTVKVKGEIGYCDYCGSFC